MSVVSRAAGKAAAQVIKNEIAINANTATRVGGNIEDGWDSFAMDSELTSLENAAILDTDTSLVGAAFFLDEDDMVSDDATKVPSQQSVKAYVDDSKIKSIVSIEFADSPYSIIGTEDIIQVDCTSGNVAINDLAANVITSLLIIQKIDASVNIATLTPNGAETINGASDKDLTAQFESLTRYSDGSNLFAL